MITVSGVSDSVRGSMYYSLAKRSAAHGPEYMARALEAFGPPGNPCPRADNGKWHPPRQR